MRSRQVFWGVLLILFGTLLLLDNLNVLDFGEAVRRFWPLLLVAWGIKILFFQKSSSGLGATTTMVENPPEKEADLFDAEFFSRNILLGDIKARIKNEHFRGGNASLALGDIWLDLRNAALAEGSHRLKVSAGIGDIHILLPKNMAYEVAVSVAVGEYFDSRGKRSLIMASDSLQSEGYQESDRRLSIQISAMIADIGIYH